MTSVIKLEKAGAIATVALEEREFRNTFTKAFVQGLFAAFDEIAADPALKVVVVRGFDPYFCCGGTKEELLDIFAGKLQFTDVGFYDLMLRCELPVIAAVSGHAVGGGLAFACYADMMVLAEESIYSANFMKYGFTPGMGATYIIPRRFGEALGHELLYSAENYRGIHLQERGVPYSVVKKDQVLDRAMELAQAMADKPQLPLKVLKAHLTREIREIMPGIIEREVAMHQTTFANPEVRERIEVLFGN